MTFNDEIVLQGIPVSEGIAIGTPYFLKGSSEEEVPEFPITLNEVDQEINRYRNAIFSSREELLRLQNRLANEGSADAIKIIDTHIQMLSDPLMTIHIEDKIREIQFNTESVFQTVIKEYRERFSQNSDFFFMEKLTDVLDLSKRILHHLGSNHENTSPLTIPSNAVIFAKELAPSDTASVQTSHVSGFVTRHGGINSHAAVIARAKGIPFVVGVDLNELAIPHYTSVIVDGETGKVILNPSESTLKKYKEVKNQIRTKKFLLEKEAYLSAETKDGYSISIFANVSSLEDIDSLFSQGATGIGLIRSEYLFLDSPEALSSEEDQYVIYSKIFQKAKEIPIVIRVFDFGGDKLFFEGYQEKKSDTVLGCRGMRFLFRHPHLFKVQIRAILRAAFQADVRLLLPLVSDIDELKEAKRLIQEIKEDLLTKGFSIKQDILIGSMIELPCAALIADLLAEESDFLSIGTNDLVQYTLGVDRNDAAMSDFYQPNHLSVIRIIKMIIAEAEILSKPLTVCGEIASNPFFVPLLLGLGVKQFSCAPPYVARIKKMVRSSHLPSCIELAQRVLKMKSAIDISNLLIEEYQKQKP